MSSALALYFLYKQAMINNSVLCCRCGFWLNTSSFYTYDELNVIVFGYICFVFKFKRKSLAKEFISKLCNSNFGILIANLNSYRSSYFCTADGHKNNILQNKSSPGLQAFMEKARGKAERSSSSILKL